MQEHRHLFRAVWRDRAFFGEAPRDQVGLEPLVRERHPGPPAIGAERTLVIGADEFEKFECHSVAPPRFAGWAKQRYRTTAAVCPNRILRSSSVRIAGCP